MRDAYKSTQSSGGPSHSPIECSGPFQPSQQDWFPEESGGSATGLLEEGEHCRHCH